jgi:hypothetical protein
MFIIAVNSLYLCLLYSSFAVYGKLKSCILHQILLNRLACAIHELLSRSNYFSETIQRYKKEEKFISC